MAKQYKTKIVPIWKDWYFFDAQDRKWAYEEIPETLLMNHIMPDKAEWHYNDEIGTYLIPVYTAEQIDREAMYFNQELDYENEKAELDRVHLPEDVYIWGTVGRWNGASSGASPVGENTLAACLYAHMGGNFLRVWVEGAEIHGEEVHHDGTNTWIMRMVNPELTTEEREKFEELLETGHANEAMELYTVPLGDKVREVYGVW